MGRKGAAERVRNLKIQRRCGRKRVMVWGSEISKLESVRGTSDGARVLNLRIQRKCGRKQVMGEGEKSQNPEKVWEGRGGSAKRKWLSIGSRRGGEVAVGSWLMKWRRIGVLGRCGYGLWGDEESRLAMAPAVTIDNSQGCREGTACGLSGVGCGRVQVAGRETRKRKRKDICRPN